MTEITIPNLTLFFSLITLLGIIFSVYHYFKNPQIKSETTDAILTLRFDTLEKSFNNLRDNHIHSIDLKLEENGKDLKTLSIEVTKLATIISERIPKKL